jgi:hypothetical protein
MPAQGRARPAREELEPIVDVARDLGNRQRLRACGRQFDRQRNAVETTADLRNRRDGVVVGCERSHVSCAGDEQAHSIGRARDLWLIVDARERE